MKACKAAAKFITMSIALVAMASAGATWTAEGTDARRQSLQDDQALVFFLGGIPSVGLVPGQTLRLSVANTVARLDDRVSTETLSLNFVRFRLYDAHGNIIAQSGEITIPPAQFRSFDFNRSDLPSPGEPGTGRLQVRLQVEVSVTARGASHDAPNLFPASLELVDHSTGKTVALRPVVQQLRCATQSNGETKCRIVSLQ